MIFDEKYLVNSIDFQYNIDNKRFMQSSGIHIFIGTYRQLTLILLSILLIFDINYYVTI